MSERRVCSNGVPIRRETQSDSEFFEYVLLRDIPAEHYVAFDKFMYGSACPVPSERSLGDAVYVWDYEEFLSRLRRHHRPN